jgi:hypothetical protein
MPLPASQIHVTQQTAALPFFPNGSIHAGTYTLIFRVRQAQTKDLLKEHKLILMPQRFAQHTDARTALYYTQGGIVADTPALTGVGMTVFQISGHTGYAGIRAPAGALVDRLGAAGGTPESFLAVAQTFYTSIRNGQSPTQQASSVIDGAAAIKDLQDTIHAYFEPGSGPEIGVSTTQDLQLEFLNLTAPTSAQDRTGGVGWVIHPHRGLVDIQQDASKPFLYNYTFQFAAIAPLAVAAVDEMTEQYTNPRTGFQRTLDNITKTVRDLTNGVNTITDAFDQLIIGQALGPVNNFLLASADLGQALGNFIQSGADKLNYPLYALRQAGSVLDPVQHSVMSLRDAAITFGETLRMAADPRSLGTLGAAQSITAGLDDSLDLALNGEEPVRLHLGTQTSGPAIARTIQTQVQALTPQHAANASAYRDFTATYDPVNQQYTLSSGTKLSNSGRVAVIVPADPGLAPTDGSAALGLGIANGGQEHAGSAYPAPAIALLRGMEDACTHLLAFPDYFADQLEQQDAVLAAHFPPGTPRSRIQGDQHLRQTRITPGESLQGMANRVGVPWETLALVNRLTYPYILEHPTTLVRGRVSSGSLWGLTDVVQHWPVDAYQGQRVDIVGGAGAGQSRSILHNTATVLTLASAWSVTPNDTSDYAIRSADNPILQTGMVTSATARTLTDSALALVEGNQRGLTIQVIDGPAAGERQRIAGSSHSTYTFSAPWRVVPPGGSLYVVIGAGATSPPPRQKLVGDLLAVPHPTGQRPRALRTRLSDVSAITGKYLTQEEKLFGRDWVLTPAGSLVWDASAGDAQTVAGLPNLRQAVINLVNLPIGELEYLPGLGSYINEELGLSATMPLQTQLLASVERTIRQDARIQSMRGAHLSGQGGNVLISFGATAINGASLERITIR